MATPTRLTTSRPPASPLSPTSSPRSPLDVVNSLLSRTPSFLISSTPNSSARPLAKRTTLSPATPSHVALSPGQRTPAITVTPPAARRLDFNEEAKSPAGSEKITYHSPLQMLANLNPAFKRTSPLLSSSSPAPLSAEPVHSSLTPSPKAAARRLDFNEHAKSPARHESKHTPATPTRSERPAYRSPLQVLANLNPAFGRTSPLLNPSSPASLSAEPVESRVTPPPSPLSSKEPLPTPLPSTEPKEVEPVKVEGLSNETVEALEAADDFLAKLSASVASLTPSSVPDVLPFTEPFAADLDIVEAEDWVIDYTFPPPPPADTETASTPLNTPPEVLSFTDSFATDEPVVMNDFAIPDWPFDWGTLLPMDDLPPPPPVDTETASTSPKTTPRDEHASSTSSEAVGATSSSAPVSPTHTPPPEPAETEADPRSFPPLPDFTADPIVVDPANIIRGPEDLGLIVPATTTEPTDLNTSS